MREVNIGLQYIKHAQTEFPTTQIFEVAIEVMVRFSS